MRPIFIAFVLSLLASLSHAEDPALINVSANAIAKGMPDQAQLKLVFSANDFEADDARRRVAKNVQAFLKRLDRFSLAENSLDTSGTNLYPRYDYHNKQRALKDYEFTRRVSFKINDLSELDALMSVITKTKATRIDNISFGIQQPGKLQKQALRKAIKSAKQKAATIAAGFNVELGKIHRVTHHADNNSRPGLRSMAMASEAADSPAQTYQQKELEVRAAIDVAFTFE
jgi:uncharacterized protein